jgi:hypothetical protein
LKNLNLSQGAKASLHNMSFTLGKSSEKPAEMEIITKKIKPAKFKHSVPFKALKRRSENEGTTEKQTAESSSEKPEKTTEKINKTQAPSPSSTSTKAETTGTPKLISNLFKPVKEFKNMIKKKSKEAKNLFSLSDQDQKRSVEIPATNKEDIDKILEMGAPLMEFKSVIGKTLDSQGVLGKLFDEHESTKIASTTIAPPQKTTTGQKKTTLSSSQSIRTTTGTPSTTKQVTTTSNLTLLPLKVING